MSLEDGFPHFEELHPKEAGIFKSRIQAAKKASPNGSAVDVHKVGDYKNMRLFMTRDGHAGYAVSPEGELNSVFKHPASPYENVARRAAEHGVLIGGATHLSAFDTNGKLPSSYQKGGFKAVGRNAWNEDYKPSGWKVSRDRRPDVVFMSADRTVAQHGYPEYKQESTPYVSDHQHVDSYTTGMIRARGRGEEVTSEQLPHAGKTPRMNEFTGGHDNAKA